MPLQRLFGFTLVELLIVVAILAVLGTGVAVSYGRTHVERAKREMTRHEMGEIRQAFQQFYADNSLQLLHSIKTATSKTETLPTSAFCATFRSTPPTTGDDRIYGMLEFFEHYGLWVLLQPTIRGGAQDYFISFNTFDALSGEGWQGPYLTQGTWKSCAIQCDSNDSDSLEDWVQDDTTATMLFPQIATRYGGLYHIVYFEHCENDSDSSEPIYRRLLLVCSSTSEQLDRSSELLGLSGNRRQGITSYPLDLTTGLIPTYDESKGYFFVELLNLDQWTTP